MLQVSEQQATDSDLSMSTMSDDHIRSQTRATHAPDNKIFDVEPLLAVVRNVLNNVTFADNVPGTTYAQLEETLDAGFSPPLCTLKELSVEMACMNLGEDIAHKTTMSILERLSSYSWNAKVVLTLAAFALDYGEFWVLDQFHPSDQLAKSVGILKGVLTILKRSWLEKHNKAIVELHNLIKDTLQVSECILDLLKLSSDVDKKDLMALSTTTGSIPIYVYWSIKTVAACTNQFYCLIKNEEKTQNLGPFTKKINMILNILKREIGYLKLVKIMRNSGDMAVKETGFRILIDCSTNKKVGTKVVKTRNVLLFISSLDISLGEIELLKPIYEEISKKDQSKIVWIPIVEEWTNDVQKKFEILSSKMPSWCIVLNAPIIVSMHLEGVEKKTNAICMIKLWRMNSKALTSNMEKAEELPNGEDEFGYLMFDISPEVVTWMKEGKHIFFYGGEDKQRKQQFTDKVKVFAKDPVIENAKFPLGLFCMEEGSKGWKDGHNILLDIWNPIEETKPDPEIPPSSPPIKFQSGEKWFEHLMVGILPKDQDVSNWIKSGNYSFFYGNEDDKKKQEFNKGLDVLRNNENFSAKLFCVGKSSNGQKDDPDILSKFWKCIETRTETDDVTKDLKKLLSYRKRGNGWAVLYSGHKFICSGNGTRIMEVLNEFYNPKLPRGGAFQSCFQDYYRKNGEEWFGYLIITNRDLKKASNWFAEGKHIFFYGGQDEEGIKEFTKALAENKAIENADISRKFYPNPLSWAQLSSAEISPSISDNLKQKIKMLHSYRDEKLWVMLCEGYELKYSRTLTLPEMMDLLLGEV